MKKIIVNADRCLACGSCELACAVEHSPSRNLMAAILNKETVQPRVRVETAKGYAYPIRCQHCEDAPCVLACPTGAMSRHSEHDIVDVNQERCIGCWMCNLVCPFGAILTQKDTAVAIKCDACLALQREGNDPACVIACTSKALLLKDEPMLSKEKRIRLVAAMSESAKKPDQPAIVLWREGRH